VITQVNGYVGANPVVVFSEFILYGTADTAQPLTIAQPVTLSYGAQTASLTGIAAPGVYAPQDFSTSGLNIPAYVVSNTATVANTVAYTSFGPFAGEGSLYFPGGGAPRISFGVQPQFAYNWTSYDFTMECFLYNTSRPYDQRLLSRDADVLMYIQTSGNLLTFYSAGITSPASGLFIGGAVPLNQWNHVAVSYIASTTTFYICVNGSVTTVPKVTGTFQYTGTNNTNFDYWNGQSGSNFGYLSNFRFTRGQALYTTTFTPPTAPLQPIQGVTQSGLPYGTVLLLRNAPAPGRVLTQKFSGLNSSGVLSFPPAAMTNYSTTLNAGYGQGVYVASASSEYGSPNFAYTGFSKAITNGWSPANGQYSGTPGTYQYSNVTVDVTGSSYAGEWLQIQMPSSISLSNYAITNGNATGNSPYKWRLFGSRDGVNWYLIDSQSNISWSALGTKTFAVAAAQAFTYLRLSVNQVQGGSGANPVIGDITYNGTIEGPNVTADGRLGVGVSNPVQALEVAGSAVVAGTVSSGSPFTFKNAFYNGDFRIAQRGTSFVNPNGVYTLDRWYLSTYGATGNGTVSQIQSGLSNFANAIQIATTSATVANWWISQSLETRDVVRFQGQPVTVSFWYRIPTSFTQSWIIRIAYNTSVDARISDDSVSSSFSTNVNLSNQTAWTYASFTGFIPESTRSLTIQFVTTNNIVNGAQFQLTGVQLERGTVATPFEVRPFATELALCQRYYEKSFDITVAPVANSSGNNIVMATSNTGTTYQVGSIPFKVTKRVASGTVNLYNPYNAVSVNTSLRVPAGGDVTISGTTATVSGININMTGQTVALSYHAHFTYDAEL